MNKVSYKLFFHNSNGSEWQVFTMCNVPHPGAKHPENMKALNNHPLLFGLWHQIKIVKPL